MKKVLFFLIFFLIAGPAFVKADDFLEKQLNRGIRSSEVYSSMLIKQAAENRTDSISLLKRASEYSPNMPSVYFALAKANLSFSGDGIFFSLDYTVKGITAYARNFWWLFRVAGGTFLNFIISFFVAVVVMVVIRFFHDMPLLSHEIEESNYKAILLACLVVLSALSPLLLLACLMVLLGLYMNKTDRIVVYILLLTLLFSPVIFKAAAMFLDISSSGRMKAIVDVNESKDNAYAITALKSSDDAAALFSYALALKREGNYQEAIAIFSRLIKDKKDPKIYVNLGNSYVGLGRMENAIENYQNAIKIRPLASAYYNLSQIYRELLDFIKGDEYFNKALDIDRNAVSEYRTVHGRHPNRLVVDETLSDLELWRIAQKGMASKGFGLAIVPLWIVSFSALGLGIGFFYLTKRSKTRSFRCAKCSSILCPQCEKHLIWKQMCPNCYRSLIKLDELEARERVARLLAIYEYQKKRKNIMKIFSFVLPGAAQIMAGKILNGFLLTWGFLFFFMLPITNILYAEGALISQPILTVISFIISAIVLLISNIITRQRITKGWL